MNGSGIRAKGPPKVVSVEGALCFSGRTKLRNYLRTPAVVRIVLSRRRGTDGEIAQLEAGCHADYLDGVG